MHAFPILHIFQEHNSMHLLNSVFVCMAFCPLQLVKLAKSNSDEGVSMIMKRTGWAGMKYNLEEEDGYI